MRRYRALLLIGFVAFIASILPAQVVITSTILGTISDQQGAMIPQAKVTLRNMDTGVTWNAVTNGGGDYQFPNLIAGHYRV